jgi:hypothetical protein
MLPLLAEEYEKSHAEVKDVIAKHYKVDSDW